MAEDMLESMDNAGVDGVVTFAIGIGEPSDYRETNQYISNAMKQHAGRIHGFMRLSPGNGPKDTPGAGRRGQARTQRDQDSSADRTLPGQRQRESLPADGGGATMGCPFFTAA